MADANASALHPSPNPRFRRLLEHHVPDAGQDFSLIERRSHAPQAADKAGPDGRVTFYGCGHSGKRATWLNPGSHVVKAAMLA